jgi:hypothetical protein
MVVMVATRQTRNPQGMPVVTPRSRAQVAVVAVVGMALGPQVGLAETDPLDTSAFGEKTNANQ